MYCCRDRQTRTDRLSAWRSAYTSGGNVAFMNNMESWNRTIGSELNVPIASTQNINGIITADKTKQFMWRLKRRQPRRSGDHRMQEPRRLLCENKTDRGRRQVGDWGQWNQENRQNWRMEGLKEGQWTTGDSEEQQEEQQQRRSASRIGRMRQYCYREGDCLWQLCCRWRQLPTTIARRRKCKRRFPKRRWRPRAEWNEIHCLQLSVWLLCLSSNRLLSVPTHAKRPISLSVSLSLYLSVSI